MCLRAYLLPGTDGQVPPTRPDGSVEFPSICPRSVPRSVPAASVARAVMAPGEVTAFLHRIQLVADTKRGVIACACGEKSFVDMENIDRRTIVSCPRCGNNVCCCCGWGFDNPGSPPPGATCPRCQETQRAAAEGWIHPPGNRHALLRWSSASTWETRSPVLALNRYIRLLPEHRPPLLEGAIEAGALLPGRDVSLREEAYCYPAHAVPPKAVAMHVLRVVTAPEGEPMCPLKDIPLRKTSMCNALNSGGVTVCNVCQAASSPGNPLPISHWGVCPRWDGALRERASQAGVTPTEERKRWAVYAALRSVPSRVRDDALAMLAHPESALRVGASLAERWRQIHPRMMPPRIEIAKMDVDEANMRLSSEALKIEGKERHNVRNVGGRWIWEQQGVAVTRWMSPRAVLAR